uniref:Uncharacterized protein n=1 Tax=Aegilops tauschii TaxID=37682 RepID=M8BRG8_AEGTA
MERPQLDSSTSRAPASRFDNKILLQQGLPSPKRSSAHGFGLQGLAAAGDRPRHPAREAPLPWLGACGAKSSTDGKDKLQGSAVEVDVPLLWDDEGRMKRELVAWAKAVASMAIRESMRC